MPLDQLGNYRIIQKIGQGGMAEVYKAVTTDKQGIERLVVIKRILPKIASDPDYIAMLVKEAKIAVHFTHGNIAQIYDLGKIDTDYFIVMEYVPGPTLAKMQNFLAKKRIGLPCELAAYILIELLRGLDYIHQKILHDGQKAAAVHRDVSPQNLILSHSGTVKLIDFGVAKLMHQIQKETDQHLLKGKFSYMSPEQTYGSVIDFRSDIFSAGIILWELLAGRRLFKRATHEQTVKAVRSFEIPHLTSIQSKMDPQLDSICQKALARSVDERYRSAGAMADDLARYLAVKYSDFRPAHLARFIYDYLGPEEDERNRPHLFSRIKIKPLKPRLLSFPGIPRKSRIFAKKPKAGFMGKNFKLGLLGGVLFFLLSLVGFWAYRYFFSKAELVLFVKPENSQVFIEKNQLKNEKAPFFFFSTHRDQVEITVKKPGFPIYKKKIQLKKNQRQTLAIDLNKDLAQLSQIQIFTKPKGATVYIDDNEQNQKTPLTIQHLKAKKTYTISFYLDGYVYLEDKIKLEPGKNKRLSYTLKPDYATINIVSIPKGAKIWLEDKLLGEAPLQVEHLMPYQKYFFRAVYQKEKKEWQFELKPGETIDWQINF